MNLECLTPEEMRLAVSGEWLDEGVSCRVDPVGVVIDSREDLRSRCFLAIIGERTDGHLWLASAVEGGAVMLIIQKDRRDAVDPTLAASIPVLMVSDTREALTRLAVAWRARLEGVVVGITGSAGKTTTRRLVQSICERHVEDQEDPGGGCTASVKSYNNDIGVPLTILRARSDDRFVILEIGTNAPGEIAMLSSLARPDLVVITNAGRAHLEGLGTIEGVAREKASILEGLAENGLVVMPSAPGPLREEVLARLGPTQHVCGFGAAVGEGGLHLTARETIDASGAQKVTCSDGFEFRMRLPGTHNALNALAAILVARALDITEARIGLGLAELDSDPMRFSGEPIGDSGIMVYNDAYNANPDAVLAALETFGEVSVEATRRVLILGDMMELGDDASELHAEIGRAVLSLSRATELSCVVFIGPLSANGARVVLDARADMMVVQCSSLNEALSEGLAGMIQSGDSVLIKGSRSQALERVVASLRASRGSTISLDPHSV